MLFAIVRQYLCKIFFCGDSKLAWFYLKLFTYAQAGGFHVVVKVE